MRKLVAIILFFSFLFAVDANGEEREVEILTGPEIKNREEVILVAPGSGEEKGEKEEEETDKKKAEEALARVKARAEAEKEKEEISFISSSGRLTPEEQEEAAGFILKVLLVLAIIWLSQVVKTEKTD